MAGLDIQKGIIEAIKTVVESELGSSTTTSSKIGYVVENPSGYDCIVAIGGQNYSCQIPEHLHSWVQKDDVVIIQDLYGDGVKRVVTGKTGSRNSAPSLVFYDEEKERNVSGVDIIVDEIDGSNIDTFGTVINEGR